jgi:alpha-amylase
MSRRSSIALCLVLLALTPFAAPAQTTEVTPTSDAFLQGFYWNSNPGGIWWDSLARLAPRIGAAGFGGIWFPSPVKGNAGGFSMGYDPYDHYDFGQYNQKGQIETRFGSRQELINAISAFHGAGVQVFADAVMGHMNGGEQFVPVDCEPYPAYPDSAWLVFNYPNGSGRFRKSAVNFYPNRFTCDVNPPYHGPYDPVFKFGEVPAHDQPAVRDSFIVWGQYLRNVLKFDGFRIDAVKHIDPAFIGPWLQNTGGFAVAEYYGSTSEIGSWLNQCQNVHGGDVSMFDFPLRFTLQDMCNNGSGSFDMNVLDGAGLVNAGISGFDVATFVENHDLDRTGWDGSVDNGHNPIIQDKDMAYGYILFSEGRPSVFFRDYFTYGLAPVIDRLLWIRTTFLYGGTTKRSGLNPWYVGGTGSQADMSREIYVARRDGGNGRPQAFLVMNDHPTEWRGVWVNSSHPNQTFRDYTGAAIDKQAAGDGRVELWAPPRGIALYVPDTTQRVNHHPFITTTPDLSAFVNTPFSYQIAGGDLNGDSLTYTLSGGPLWLGMSPGGLLTGTPGVADTVSSTLIVTVADPWGGSSADTFQITVRSRPLMDGVFEGAPVWGAPVAVADTLTGWDGTAAREVYVFSDDTHVFFGAKVRARQTMNWAFILNMKGGGGSSDSWSRSISYIHTNRPDYVLRGHFQGYAEFHTWNGGGWNGVGSPLASTEFAEGLTLDSLAEGWVEARVPRTALGDPPVMQVQFYLTGPQNGNATYDACPDDQNTTAATGSPTSLRHWALRGSPALTQWNLQFPGSAVVAGGGSATVYARTFGLTLTDTTGAAAGVSAWIGVNDQNTDPASWSAWTPAVYNADYTGSDEFQAVIGPGLPGGTHYYASRFQHNGGPFLYGGYSASGGGAWNGAANVSGVLTIQAPPAVPLLLSPADGAVNVPPNAVLTWTAGSGGTTYQVQVAGDSLFASVAAEDSGLAQSSFAPGGLAYGSLYYWRVRGVNGFGAGGWSGVRSFTVFVPEDVTLSLAENWNMLSVPLTVVDGRRSVLFPTASSAAYAFQSISGYVQRDTLRPGAGYWVKFGPAQDVVVSGGRRESDSVVISSGWNLVGSITEPVAASAVVQWPDSILRSEFYAYDGGYSVADSLRPGRAYWVKSASTGALLLTAGGPFGKRTAGGVASRGGAGWSSVVVEDAVGNRQRLYAAAGADPAQHEMPPRPPAGVFDARFVTGSMLAAEEAELVLSDAVYPVRVRVDGEGGGVRLVVNGREVADRVLVLHAPALLTVSPSGASVVPAEFALEQNYPNPFNPATVIGVALPVESRVSVRVYNLLGQRVAELLNDVRPAGMLEVRWDASALAAGVYFVRAEAAPVAEGEGFVGMRKVVLLK